MKQLSMLEGTARLRAAEQRVRDGLQSPRLEVQALPQASVWRPHAKTPSRVGPALVILAVIAIAVTLGVAFLK